ncbi:MAG: alpha/beta hydrolase [Methanomicrobiaceae archaeon]|nr:alpha/beta hydrolase [Methanomicrobiaceae archaeon]
MVALHRGFVFLISILLAAPLCAGCTAPGDSGAYRVAENGTLTITAPSPDFSATVIEAHDGVSLSRVVFENPGGRVYALLAAPDTPSAAIVYAPGAGMGAEAHHDRAFRYATKGIAFMVVDIRGHGGETSGYSMNLERDYGFFEKGRWPQYYRIVQDLMIARAMLGDRYGVPVYAAGSSDGGRYAAIAAATDEDFAGYFGVSTSGFSRAGEQYTGALRTFLLSIDPECTIGAISPRPVRIFHAPLDRVIAYDQGMALFNRAREPKDFIAFNGTHGICDEVDDRVIADVLTFKAP